MNKPLTPREKNKALRERLEKVLPELPEKWINLFMFTYPEYAEKMVFLSNVSKGRSLDVDVIEKMESLSEALKKIKNSNKS